MWLDSGWVLCKQFNFWQQICPIQVFDIGLSIDRMHEGWSSLNLNGNCWECSFKKQTVLQKMKWILTYIEGLQNNWRRPKSVPNLEGALGSFEVYIETYLWKKSSKTKQQTYLWKKEAKKMCFSSSGRNGHTYLFFMCRTSSQWNG